MNLAEALQTEAAKYKLSSGWEIKMENPVETLGADDRASRIISAEETDIMTAAKVFRWPALLLGFAVAIFLAGRISNAQNAKLGSESGLDRAMQKDAVKDKGIEPEKKEK